MLITDFTENQSEKVILTEGNAFSQKQSSDLKF